MRLYTALFASRFNYAHGIEIIGEKRHHFVEFVEIELLNICIVSLES
jgi:hypothetical protein